jgi:hypothetical protein
MTRLVEFVLEDGSTIVVESNEPEPPGGVVRATRKPGEIIEEAKGSFEEALGKIQQATESAITKLRNLSKQPDEITMEFGFNLSATFGAVIATGTAQANYKMTLTWSNKEKSI